MRKRRNKAALVERLLEIGHECAALPVLDARGPEEMLYDKTRDAQVIVVVRRP